MRIPALAPWQGRRTYQCFTLLLVRTAEPKAKDTSPRSDSRFRIRKDEEKKPSYSDPVKRVRGGWLKF